MLTSDHCVVIADLLGFGASDRPLAAADLWVDAQATALAAALDRDRIGRAVVVGHDFGVPVGLRVAADDPGRVAAFGLLSGNVFSDTPIPLPISAVTWPLLGGVAGRLLFSAPALRMMLRQGASRPLDAAAWLGDGDQQQAIATIFAYALRNIEAFAAVERDLRALEVPLHIAWGDADPFFAVEQAERTAAAARRARVAIHPGAATSCRPSARPRWRPVSASWSRTVAPPGPDQAFSAVRAALVAESCRAVVRGGRGVHRAAALPPGAVVVSRDLRRRPRARRRMGAGRGRADRGAAAQLGQTPERRPPAAAGGAGGSAPAPGGAARRPSGRLCTCWPGREHAPCARASATPTASPIAGCSACASRSSAPTRASWPRSGPTASWRRTGAGGWAEDSRALTRWRASPPAFVCGPPRALGTARSWGAHASGCSQRPGVAALP